MLRFSFPLPPNAPSSIEAIGLNHRGSVKYKLELCGKRKVSFGFDYSALRRPIVLPPGLYVEAAPPRVPKDLIHATTKEMRRSILNSSKGRVKLEICIPGLCDRPLRMHQKHPFTVTVTTFSIPVYEMVDPETNKEALFPSINLEALQLLLRLKLKRYTTVRVAGPWGGVDQETINDHEVASLGNLHKREGLQVDVGPKEWEACTSNDVAIDGKLKGKGRWRQQLKFKSTFTLSEQFATPTFAHQLINVNVRRK